MYKRQPHKHSLKTKNKGILSLISVRFVNTQYSFSLVIVFWYIFRFYLVLINTYFLILLVIVFLLVLVNTPTAGQPVAPGVGSEPGDGQLRRLLHHVSQLARQGELAVSLHPAGLHKHDLTSQRGPRQAQGHARHREALRHLKHAHTHTHI